MAISAGASDPAAFDYALMRRWRCAVAAAAADFGAVDADTSCMLLRTDAALRLEAPDLGADEAPAAYADLLGRLSAEDYARFAFTAAIPNRAPPSRLHSDVLETLRGLPGGAAWQRELSDIAYWLEAAVPALRSAVEVEGASDFCSGTGRPMGATVLRRRLLRRAGWRLASVSSEEWKKLRSVQMRRAFMGRKLREAGAEAAELEAAAAASVPSTADGAALAEDV